MTPTLTPEGQRAVDELAQRHGVSSDAVRTLLVAVAAGHGSMAQFSHQELGGMGQWSQGGMTMVGDMFNNALKHRVDALCTELSQLWRSHTLLASPPSADDRAASGSWWPAELGSPASTGSQNQVRYAYFPDARRLVIAQGGETRIYDTGDHRIGGFSQQQGGDASLAFTSQHGPVRVADLPTVPGSGTQPTAPATKEPARTGATDDVLARIERLAELKEKGILTADEFAAKKAELLARL